MANRIKRALCMAIAFATVLSSVAVSAAEEYSATEVASDSGIGENADAGITFITESGNRAMYADMSTGGFYILDKLSGEKWQSSVALLDNDIYTKGTARGNIRSEVIVNYIYTDDETNSSTEEIANSYSDSVSMGLAEVERLKNGIKATYTFDSLQSVIPVEYILEKGVLKATVRYDEIVQHKDFMITGIRLLPYFGAADWDEKGYMLVPDGSGALINFNTAITDDIYEKPVYTDSPITSDEKVKYTETESIAFPVFGMVKEHGAVLGIISQNAENASVLAYARTSTCGYNAASAKWNLRSNYPEMMFDTTFANKRQLNRWVLNVNKGAVYSVEYRFCQAGSSYVSLAQEYRKYLSENGMLPKSEELSKPTFNVDVYGAVDTAANFLGFSYSKTKALTTYKQAADIINELSDSGIENISVRYIGWGNNGLINKKLPTKMKTLRSLGSRADLNALLKMADAENIDVTLDVDFIYSTKIKKKEAVRNPFNNFVYQYSFYRSCFGQRVDRNSLCLATPKTVSKNVNKYLSSSKTDYFDLSLGKLGVLCYSDFCPSNTVLKSEMKSIILETLSAAEKKDARLTFEGANDYALPFADKIAAVPLSSSGYDAFDADVPFYQLVLHGSVAMAMKPIIQSSNPTKAFLKAVETGTELTYTGIYAHASELSNTEYDHLYSSTYTWWLDEAAERYAEYQPLMERIYDSFIVSHNEIADNVMQTVYDNGVTVTVNYNDFDVTCNGIKVSAMDYTVGGDK